MHSIAFLPSAAKALAKLDRPIQLRLARRLDRLAVEPLADAAKLRGTSEIWRVRVGDYRVIYQVEDDRLLLLVIRIGHRRDI